MDIERLLALIQEYQARVQEAVTLFQQHEGIEPINWRQENIPQTSFVDVDKMVRYFFHGIGCAVHLPSGPVDFDFGHDGRIDGFDVWRLWNFAEEGTMHFPEFGQWSTSV